MALETAWCNALVEFLQANRADRLPFCGRLGGAEAVPGAELLIGVAIEERQVTLRAGSEAVADLKKASTHMRRQSSTEVIVLGICPIGRTFSKSLALAVSGPGSRLRAP